MKQFTMREKDAISTYSSSSGCDRMNGALRKFNETQMDRLMQAVRNGDRAGFDVLMKNKRVNESTANDIWNAATAFTKTIVQETTYLRRGTSVGELGGLFIDGAYSDASATAKAMSVDEMNAAFAGKVGTYNSFVSTSAMYEKGFSNALEVVYCVPKGSEGASIMRISHFGISEGETILNVGTKVRFARAERSDGHFGSRIRVYLEVIPQH